MNGKGSRPRPVDIDKFNDNFDRIFNNKSELNESEPKKEKTNEDEEKHSGANPATSDINGSAS